MYYHILLNLGELIQGDLVSKLREGLSYKESVDRECNYNSTMKVSGMCAYRGDCRRCCVVYKVTCKCCGNLYVENTQNTQKEY